MKVGLGQEGGASGQGEGWEAGSAQTHPMGEGLSGHNLGSVSLRLGKCWLPALGVCLGPPVWV